MYRTQRTTYLALVIRYAGEWELDDLKFGVLYISLFI